VFRKAVLPITTAIVCGFTITAQVRPTGEELLAKVRAKILENVDRLSNYTCTETVERKVFELRDDSISPKACAAFLDSDRSGHLCNSDQLRLDVGIAKTGEEMFSWPEADRFEVDDPRQLLPGANTRGTFAELLNEIFRRGPVISYRGESQAGERTLAEYDFAASREQSRIPYEEDFSVITGYDGAFLVDSETSDLVQLRIRYLNLPQSAKACTAATTVDYHKVLVNGISLVLPARSQAVFIDRDGRKLVNQTTFSDCHQFVGQSELHFGREPGEGEPPHRAPAKLDVAGGIPFEIAIDEDVDIRSAAVGDPIRCKLATPLRGAEGIVAPAGTPVTARIVQLARIFNSCVHDCKIMAAAPIPGTVTFSFRLENILIGGTAQALSARPGPPSDNPHSTPSPVIWSSAGDALTGVLRPNRSMLMTNGLRTEWFTAK